MDNKTRQIFLTTKDLYLVLLETKDAELIITWFRDQEVNQFINFGQYPLTLDHEKKFLEEVYQDQSKLLLGIYHRKDQRLIGTVGIHRICSLHLQGSFGIAIGETKYWSNGYGKQALRAMLDWSFKVRGLRTITLHVLGNNKRARKCYQKCGFKPAGVIPQSVFKQGKWIDRHIMVIQSPLIK